MLSCCFSNPCFVDAANGDYRLAAGSPCIDAGDNSYVTGDKDLAGNARIANGTVDIGCYEYEAALAGGGTTWYVNGSTGSDSNSGMSESAPKATIQAAIDASSAGDMILVAPGTYDRFAADNKQIWIRSTGGASFTVIDGQDDYVRANELRLAERENVGSMVTTNTVLEGFTVQRLTSIVGGTVKRCIIRDNNTWSIGGAACNAAVVENCLIINNRGMNGSAADGCILRNCTMIGNSARDINGVCLNSVLENCIAYGNGNDERSTWQYWFDQNPLVSAVGYREKNIYTGNPGFVDAANGDYRLAAGSPCIDAGDNSYVTGDKDLVGNARIANGTVDIGCYEYGSAPAGGSLTDGLVAYYPFDGNANDASGNGNDGTIYGVTLTEDRFGNSNGAYYFGSGNYIQVAANSQLNDISDFTMSAWIRADSWYGSWIPVMSKGVGASDTRQYGLELINRGYLSGYDYASCFEIASGAENYIFTDATIPLGEWIYVAVTRGNGMAHAYLNGVEVGSLSVLGAVPFNTEALDIGRDRPGSTEYFYGVMDEVRLYNRALSAAEVKALYDGTAVTPPDTTCTVTFDANGGSLGTASSATRSVAEGCTIGSLPTPTREGYEFLGWHRGKEASSAEVSASTVVTSDLIVYAVWQIADYDIYLDANGGYVGTSYLSRNYGAALGTLPTPTRTGYTFLGWFTAASGGTQVTADTIITADATYYAQWERISYTVTFDANGGTGGDVYTYYYGDNLGSLPTPTRTGYEFLGWYTAKSGGSQVGYYTTVYGNAIYYAQWRILSYTVTFNANGGTVGTSSVTRNYGVSIGSLPTPSRTGHTFLGWYTSASGGSRVYESDAVTSSRTLYAHWQANTYTVTFNVNGGDSSCSYSRTYGSSVGTLPTASRGGYVFKGWFTAASGGSQVSSSTTVTGNATYYAHWATHAEELAATLGTANVEFSTDSNAPWFPDGSAVRSGYISHNGSSTMSVRLYGSGLLSFRWKVSSEPEYDALTYSVDGIQGGRISGEQGWSSASILVAGAGWHTVRFTYAKDGGSTYGSDCGWVDSLAWTGSAPPVTNCRIAFDANGGDGGVTRTVAKGAALGTLPAATRGGCTLLGWFTAATGGIQVYPSTVVSGDTTYYAHWQADSSDDDSGGGSGGGTTPPEVVSYRVSFDGNGGSVDTPYVTRTAGAAVGSMPTPEAEGYDFVGWFTAKAGGTQIAATTKVTADVTYYAHWQAVVDPNTLWDEDEAFDADAAAVFDGFVVRSGEVCGLVQVKVSKANKRTGVAKVKATVTLIGQSSKLSYQGVFGNPGADDDFTPGTVACKCTGHPDLVLRLGGNALWGEMGSYEIEGSRNVFKASDSAGGAALAKWQGTYALVLETVDADGAGSAFAWGYSGLTVTVGAKGKVKVQGTMVDGAKVNVTSQLLVGDRRCCIPVVVPLYSKKGGFAFNLWLQDDGDMEAGEISLWDATASKTPFKAWFGEDVPMARVGAALPASLSFMLLGEPEVDGAEVLYDFLPWEVVFASGARWTLPAAGNVKYNGESEDWYDAKESENPAGLKLTYVSKTGSFKGSFKVYAADSAGRMKKLTAKVTGVMIGGCGYGTATVKDVGSWPVRIE